MSAGRNCGNRCWRSDNGNWPDRRTARKLEHVVRIDLILTLCCFSRDNLLSFKYSTPPAKSLLWKWQKLSQCVSQIMFSGSKWKNVGMLAPLWLDVENVRGEPLKSHLCSFVFIMNLLTTQPFKGFLTLQYYLLSEPKRRPHIYQNHCQPNVS